MSKGEICFTGASNELENNDFVMKNYLAMQGAVQRAAHAVPQGGRWRSARPGSREACNIH